MIGRATPENIRAAAVADYRSSGEPLAVVARRHGVSKTALSSWVNPRPRKPKANAEDFALRGGRWALDPIRRIQVWERA